MRLPGYLYGNRLKRTLQEKGKDAGNINGNYQKYFYAYRMWQDNAVKVIEEEVKARRDVVCICLDVKNYYYSIDVKRVYEMVSIACQKHTDVLLNDLFFKTLLAWSDIFSIEKLMVSLSD